MFAYVVRRISLAIPILFGSTLMIFVLIKLAGDPLEPLRMRNPRPPEATIRLAEERLWLDRSWPEQYWMWLKGLLLHGDFGPSVRANTDIGAVLGDRLMVTMRLVLVSVAIALLFAVITGVVSAVRQYSALDYTTTFIGFLFLAMPTFWFAVLLKSWGIWFNGLDGDPSTQTFYTIGEKSVFLADPTPWNRFVDVAGHLILPTIALGLVGYAAWSRFQRASMLEVLNSDYVRLARAKGLRSRKVLTRHALRTALIPLVTVTALDIAALLSGAVITETVFQWRGMGEFLLTAIQDRDVYAMMGWMLVAALIVILFNLVADVLYGLLDPRIRYE